WGVWPDEGKPDAEALQKGIEVKAQILQNVQDWEQAHGKKATANDVQQIIDQMNDNQVFVHRSLLSDKQTPAALLSPEDAENAYVTIPTDDGTRDVYLNAIPLEDRNRYIQQIRI